MKVSNFIAKVSEAESIESLEIVVKEDFPKLRWFVWKDHAVKTVFDKIVFLFNDYEYSSVLELVSKIHDDCSLIINIINNLKEYQDPEISRQFLRENIGQCFNKQIDIFKNSLEASTIIDLYNAQDHVKEKTKSNMTTVKSVNDEGETVVAMFVPFLFKTNFIEHLKSSPNNGFVYDFEDNYLAFLGRDYSDLDLKALDLISKKSNGSSRRENAAGKLRLYNAYKKIKD